MIEAKYLFLKCINVILSKGSYGISYAFPLPTFAYTATDAADICASYCNFHFFPGMRTRRSKHDQIQKFDDLMVASWFENCTCRGTSKSPLVYEKICQVSKSPNPPTPNQPWIAAGGWHGMAPCACDTAA